MLLKQERDTFERIQREVIEAAGLARMAQIRAIAGEKYALTVARLSAEWADKEQRRMEWEWEWDDDPHCGECLRSETARVHPFRVAERARRRRETKKIQNDVEAARVAVAAAADMVKLCKHELECWGLFFKVVDSKCLDQLVYLINQLERVLASGGEEITQFIRQSYLPFWGEISYGLWSHDGRRRMQYGSSLVIGERWYLEGWNGDTWTREAAKEGSAVPPDSEWNPIPF